MARSKTDQGMPRYLVDGRIVDPNTNEIIHGTDSVHVEPKSMEVLLFLFEHAGEVISRDEIQDRIWGDVTVGQDSITNAIIKLRKAFGDDARNPRVIATIPKRGYRVVAAVELEAGKNETQVSGAPKKPTKNTYAKYWALGSFILTAVIVAYFIWPETPISETPIVKQSHAAVHDKISIAIAPFTNMGGDPQHDYLANGVEDTILTGFSQLSQLSVKRLPDSEDSAVSYQYIFEGGVLRSGAQIRIDTRLIDAETGIILWVNRYDRPFSDLIAIEDEIQIAIVDKLAAEVDAVELALHAHGYTQSIDAYDLFLRAQQALLPRDKDSNSTARALYLQAIEYDPQFARAYAGLALTYAADYRNFWTDDRAGALSRALSMAETALGISPNLPEQHWVIAYVRTQQRQLGAAKAELEEALELDPDYADAIALLGGIYTYDGSPEKTVPFLRQAMRLQPSAGYLYFLLLGRAYYYLDNCDQAEINLREALERNPSNIEARLYTVACLVRRGNVADAEWEVEEIDVLAADFSINVWLSTYPMTDNAQVALLTSDLNSAGLR